MLLVAAAGCSEDPTAIRIKLVVDPTLNTEQQVLSVINRLQLVLDTESGFSAEPDAALSLQNMDTDTDLELVYDQDVHGLTTFPLLRLRPGRDHQMPLEILARGLAGGELAALGDPVSVRFEDDADLEVSVPLDLRARFRPPRVVATLPQDGQDKVPAALGYIYVVFSKWIKPSTMTGNLKLVYQGTGGEQSVAGAWDHSNSTVTEMGQPEERTTATFKLGDCSLAPGTYRIEASSSITDTAGNPLDQHALSEQLDSFSATFTLPGAPGTEPCESTPVGCQEDSDCDPSTPPQYVCAKDEGADVGQCVPIPTSCDSAVACPEGYRCESDDNAQVFCIKEEVEVTCSADTCPDGYRCESEGEQIFCIREEEPSCSGVTCPEGFACESGPEGGISCVKEEVPCSEDPTVCPQEFRCNDETNQCVPCEVYPSYGCLIGCTEGQPNDCPEGTFCDFEDQLCRTCPEGVC